MDKKKFKKLVKDLNEAEIIQTDFDIEYDLRDCKFIDSSQSLEPIATDLFVDKHRWHECSIDVIEIEDFYLGVEHISQFYSESGGLRDAEYVLKFQEMEQIMQPTYLIKKINLDTLQSID